jgi:hypothetical protein
MGFFHSQVTLWQSRRLSLRSGTLIMANHQLKMSGFWHSDVISSSIIDGTHNRRAGVALKVKTK